MAEPVTLTIDGREVEVPAGTSVLDACFHAGIEIPYFCSYQGLSPIGACRMCLVEIGTPSLGPDRKPVIGEDGRPKITFMPKLMASCTLAVTPGMVVFASTPVVREAREGMMELHLINHPLDCPVCDKGGACDLQDQSYRYGRGYSRFEFDKRVFEKAVPLSDTITLDRERCIHCKRCVRYFEEIPGDPVLDFIDRGVNTFIGVHGQGLDSLFTGNITDMCPVGALTDTVARFRGRNWEYDRVRSTCTLCPAGCSTTLDARNGRLERIKGGVNLQVNFEWLCDRGRFAHEETKLPSRLRRPMVRRNGELVPVTWAQAARAAAAGLQGRKVAARLHGSTTLEGAIAVRAFLERLGSSDLDYFPRYAGPARPVLPAATLHQVAASDRIVVLGADLSEEAPILELRVLEALRGVSPPQALSHGPPLADLRIQERMEREQGRLAVFNPAPTRLDRFAGEVTIFRPGDEVQAVEVASAAFVGAQRPVIVYGSYLLASPHAAEALSAIAALGQRWPALKALALQPSANAWGLEALGLGEGEPRYRRGTGGTLILSGLDPVGDGLEATLEEVEFLIVHDQHLTATAERADVVLPAEAWTESDGWTVNLEGRLLQLNAATIDAGEAKGLLEVAAFLAALANIEIPLTRPAARKAVIQSLALTEGDHQAINREGVLLEGSGRVQRAAAPGRVSDRGVLVTAKIFPPLVAERNPLSGKPYQGDWIQGQPSTLRNRGLAEGATLAVRIAGVTRKVQVRAGPAPEGWLVAPPRGAALPGENADLELVGEAPAAGLDSAFVAEAGE